MTPLAGAVAVASATVRDVLRRPAVLLAAFAVAVLLLLLPDICLRAVDETSALALQVGVSTVGLFLLVASGVAGVRAGAAEGDLGASDEWAAAPLSPASYVAGRFAGLVAVAAALLLALAPFLVVTQLGQLRENPPSAAVVLFATSGVLLSAAQFAAIGLLLAVFAPPQLAAVSLFAILVATRTIVPELASRGGALSCVAAVLPDTARLDLSRELAFDRSLHAGSAALGALGAALHTTACLVAAEWGLRRRRR